MTDINVVIAGAAGQGVQGAATMLGKVLLRLGFQVFTTQDAQSRIRGGHNFSSVRFSDHPLGAGVRRIDFLLALNHESLARHLEHLTPEGMAFCVAGTEGDLTDDRLAVLDGKLGPEGAGRPQFHGVKLLAMLAGRLGLPQQVLSEVVREQFGKTKGEAIIDQNLQVIEAVFSSIEQGTFRPVALPAAKADNRMLISGHEAVALGMIGGVIIPPVEAHASTAPAKLGR